MEKDIINIKDGELLQVASSDDYAITESEAQDLTESIKSTTVALAVLLQRAHQLKAWKAMGYASWKEYIEEEFKFSRARSYQLLDQGNVIKAVSEAGDTELYLTEKEAKIIKKELPNITERISHETDGLSDEERARAAKEIIDGEVQHALHNDKDTYNEGRDIDNMIDEDGGQMPSQMYKNQSGAGEESEWGDPSDTQESSVETSNFYYENLKRTLAVMEAFPNAEELASIINVNPEEKLKLLNSVRYAVKWLNSLDNAL